MASPSPLKAPTTRSRVMRLRVTVWVDDGAAWHSQAEWGDQLKREFDSPLELARFIAQLPPRRPPRARGGLR